MSSTTTNGIIYPTSDDPIAPLESVFAAMAGSVDTNFAPKANPTFTGTVTAPTFSGNLTGNVTGTVTGTATKTTNLANGAAGSVPYQSAADTTSMVAAPTVSPTPGTGAFVLKSNGASAPSWIENGLGGPTTLPIMATSTYWFGPDVVGQAAAGATITQNRVYYTPFYVPTQITIDSLAVKVTTLLAGTSVNVAVYNSSATTGLPTTQRTASVNIPTTTSSAFAATALASATVLPAGFYWFGVVCGQATSATLVTTGWGTNIGGKPYMPMPATYTLNLPYPELYETTTGGTLPTTASATPSTASSNRSPIVMARRSA